MKRIAIQLFLFLFIASLAVLSLTILKLKIHQETLYYLFFCSGSSFTLLILTIFKK